MNNRTLLWRMFWDALEKGHIGTATLLGIRLRSAYPKG